jgi:Ran GTPase-activating protein (RanGAP) involved in mRNA processing and transport
MQNKISNNGFIAIASMLETNTTLHDINLRKNNIKEKRITAIVTALTNNYAVRF